MTEPAVDDRPPVTLEPRQLPVSHDLPAMILHYDALTHNARAMTNFVRARGVHLAPHAKTTLSPELVRRQLAHKPWGMTAANVVQARGLLAAGAPQVILANQVADPSAIHLLGALAAAGEPSVSCFVDSLDGIALLERHLPDVLTDQLPVFVEHGYRGGRSGTRSLADLVNVAKAIVRSPRLRLRGLAGYEGQLPLHGQSIPPGLHPYLDDLRRGVGRITEAGLWGEEPVIVTAGGSAFFDVVADVLAPAVVDAGVEIETVLRSGCYLTHDHGLYERTAPGAPGRERSDAPGFKPALELLAPILSIPEPGLAIVGFGRRHVPIDDAPPVLIRVPARVGSGDAVASVVVRLNDQHAYLSIPISAAYRVGDILGFGVSHPCGAFDRWRRIPMISPDGTVIETITTCLEDHI